MAGIQNLDSNRHEKETKANKQELEFMDLGPEIAGVQDLRYIMRDLRSVSVNRNEKETKANKQELEFIVSGVYVGI